MAARGKDADGVSAQNGVNVQVLLRCRPLSAQEKEAKAPQVVTCNDASLDPTERCTVTVAQNVAGKQMGKTFHFDKVFGPTSSQSMLYDQAIRPIVREMLDGFNCTIFTYGQTGTGKTYTMEGGDRVDMAVNGISEVAGVIPRAIHQIFQHLNGIGNDYTVKCSFMELYNEEATDLLTVGETTKLDIKANQQGVVVVKGLEEFIVHNAEDIYSLLDRGSAKRRTAVTLLNKQSSRSHSVFCISTHMREVQPDGEEVIKIGKLYLVDLAGSENVSRSGAVDARAKEAGSINKSLHYLGRVINALVEKQIHIPYRDSKLTYLLRDSLGGRTKTCMIATIAPTVQCLEETLSTLGYAHRARNIRNKPEINQKVSKVAHIKELNGEIDRLKSELYAMREKNGVYLPFSIYEEKEADLKELHERCASLTQELETGQSEATARLEAQAAQLRATQEELHSTQEQLHSTQASLQLARQGLHERDYLISAHGRSEDRITSKSHELRLELAKTAAELGAVFRKVDEKTTLERSNAACVQEIRKFVSSKLQELKSAAAEATEQQKGLASQIEGRLASHAAEKAAAVTKFEQQMQQLQTEVAATAASANDALDGTVSASASGAQAVTAAHAEHMVAAQNACMAASTAIESACRELRSTLDAHAQELTAFAAQHKAEADAATAAMSTAVDVSSRALEAASACAAGWQQEASARRAEQQEAVKQLQQTSQVSLAAGQEELMNVIQSTLARLAEEHQAKTRAAAASVCKQFSDADAASTAHATRLQDDAATSVQQLQASNAASLQTARAAAAARQEWHAKLQAGVDSSRSAGEQLKTQAAAALDSQLAGQRQLQSTVQQAVDAAAAAVQGAAETGLSACTDATTAIADSHGRLAEAAQQSWTSTDACTTAVRDATHQTSHLWHGLVQNCSNASTDVSTGVAGRIEKKYTEGIQTDDLPPKRRVPVPSERYINDLRTPAPDVILADFRNKQAQDGHANANMAGNSPEAAVEPDSSPDAADEKPVRSSAGGKRSASGSSGRAAPLRQRDPNAQADMDTQPAEKRRRTEAPNDTAVL